MSNKNKKQIALLDYIVDLFQRYEQGQASNSAKQALDSWTPDMSDIENYPMDEQKITDARKKVSRHVTAHIRRDQRRRNIQPLRNLYQRYAAIAAIVVLIGGGTWIAYQGTSDFLQPGTNRTADAPKAWATDDTHRTTVTLPDGTVVQLNAGSRLEITEATFNRQKREVWLSGEAFFEVAKNPEKPFIIHTGTMQTTVRGTSFNVKAYGELGENVVSVRNGRVEIVENRKTIAVLTANRRMKYRTTDGHTEISNADWRDAAGWMEGRLVLNEASAEELRLRLRQQFGVTVRIENDALSGRLLSGIFRKESTLEEVMATIGEIHQVHYKIQNNQVTITP